MPSEMTVYKSLGVSEEEYGEGLGIVPQPPRGGEPKTSMNVLIILAIIGSPRKCLLGYEIAAILKGHFYYYRESANQQKWLVRLIVFSYAQSALSQCVLVPSFSHTPPQSLV